MPASRERDLPGEDLTLAICRDAEFGLRDVGKPCLSFSAYVQESSAALQCLFGEDITKALKDAGAVKFQHLEGWPCWVDTSRPGIIRYVRMWKNE